ncbi:hypothetical protein JQ596_24680 [Bradyrhizobium manausense]|uniref:hypothetical protein n=1 Tax=Bradyrhizobium manausense TaxID=989370 RepID=UPI001BA5758D|nr:hypothetical protein [Bradyrhizobium manausense]MBR0828737.1 hypothetical protein [Bradyrhizobium manausense]
MNNDSERTSAAPSIVTGAMSAYPSITPPGALDAALAPLAELSDFEFQGLLFATSKPRSFLLSSKELKGLREQIPSVASNLPFLLSALSFLYSRIDALGEVSEPFDQVIARLVDELDFQMLDAQKKATIQKRLEELLKKNPGFGRFQKILRLQDGFIPNATRFRSMVDLRPDFGESDDSLEYKGVITTIQFRVVTDSSNPSLQEMIFQVNEEVLEDLRKAVDRAQKKIALLKQEPKLAGQILGID